MNPPDTYQQLGKSVSFAEIDLELAGLWADNDSQVRASLMNLAVFSTRSGSLLENERKMQELMSVHACRAILIELNADAPDNSSYAWVKAYCRFMGGTKTVCNEQISFWLNGHMRGRIPNSVFAHLDSDLPLLFWWQGELTSVFRPRLYKRMNRFIFDSAEWENPGISYERIRQAYADTYGQMIPHDLEWARTFHLRMGVSKLFDEPDALAVLGEIDRIGIRYNPRHRVAVALLVAWIAKQARFRWEKTDGDQWHFRAEDGRVITVETEQDPASYLISGLSFHTGEYDMGLSREGDSAVYQWKINLPGLALEKLVPADPAEAVPLVAGQIARGGHNTILTSLLDTFIHLWQSIGK